MVLCLMAMVRVQVALFVRGGCDAVRERNRLSKRKESREKPKKKIVSSASVAINIITEIISGIERRVALWYVLHCSACHPRWQVDAVARLRDAEMGMRCVILKAIAISEMA
jgi:hypothetical protein